MSLSRFVPVGFDEDLRACLAADLSSMNQQLRRLNNNYNMFLGASPAMAGVPWDIGLNEAFRMDNPIITDKDGNKKFHLEFDLRHFKPEEVHLSTADNVLSVHAKHEEKSEGRTSFREYRRQYTIPDSVNVERLKSKLSHDGVLSIEAPVEKKVDVMIPITHN